MSHFDFQLLANDGSPTGSVIQLESIKGVILACPTKMSALDITHLCKFAMKTPDYPYDLCLWEGLDPNPFLKWSARIYYRSNANVEP